MQKEIKADLEKVLAYMTEATETDYQERFNDDDVQEGGHIYESVLAIKSWLSEQN